MNNKSAQDILTQHPTINLMDKQIEKPKQCLCCKRELDLGVDALIFREGVMGPRGIVPLAEPTFFCSEECIAKHFGDHDVTKLQRRIP